jgi:hypothetical protein
MSHTANKYGMGDTDDHYDCRTSQVIDENEPEEGDMSSVMVHTCECCGEEKEVLPPRGFRVKSVALTEAVATFRALYSGPALVSSSGDALQAFRESYRSLEVAR